DGARPRHHGHDRRADHAHGRRVEGDRPGHHARHAERLSRFGPGRDALRRPNPVRGHPGRDACHFGCDREGIHRRETRAHGVRQVNRGKELLVGVVILAATVVGVAGTLWLQGSSFGQLRIPVDVRLESVGQLAEGNAVIYRGVPIGQVTRIEVEPGGQAVRVRLMLSQAINLPEDAAVVLGPESIFGAWQAEIVSRSSYPRFDFFDVRSHPDDTGSELAGQTPPTALLGGYALPELSRLTASAEEISVNLADLTAR